MQAEVCAWRSGEQLLAVVGIPEASVVRVFLAQSTLSPFRNDIAG